MQDQQLYFNQPKAPFLAIFSSLKICYCKILQVTLARLLVIFKVELKGILRKTKNKILKGPYTETCIFSTLYIKQCVPPKLCIKIKEIAAN